MIEILTRKPPFPDMTNAEVGQYITTFKKIHDIPEDCPPRLQEILLQCWEFNPENRPTFGNLYEALTILKEGFEEEK